MLPRDEDVFSCLEEMHVLDEFITWNNFLISLQDIVDKSKNTHSFPN